MTEQSSQRVVYLPLLRGSSMEDTFSGFAEQMEKYDHLGKRVERAVTVLVGEIRGWPAVAGKIGEPAAEQALSEAVDRILESAVRLGAADPVLSGDPKQPTLTLSFSGDQHALRAVVAAETIRESAYRSLHPSIPERFHGCIGLHTGAVVDTQVNGSGIGFQASGTTRMFAVRLQEFAGPDQIFLSEATYHAIPAALDVVPLGPVRTSGGGETQEAYCLRGLILASES